MVELKPYAKGVESEHSSGIIQNNTVDVKLVALPWFTDASLLYYRNSNSHFGDDSPE